MSDTYVIDLALLKAYAKALKDHGGTAGVTGVDIGLVSNGKGGERLGVRVHFGGVPPQVVFAKEKALMGMIAGAQPPGMARTPLQAIYQLHDGAPLLPVKDPRLQWQDVLQPGLCVSHSVGGGGTLGLIVADKAGTGRYVLSNRHVIVRPDGIDDVVLQPSADEGAFAPAYTIGNIAKVGADGADAAVARLNTSRKFDRKHYATGVAIDATRRAKIGEVVQKHGLGTDLTEGRVDGIGRYWVIPKTGNASAVTIDGIRVVPLAGSKNPISDSGDSGSVWYTKSGHVGVGLHVGGEPGASGSGKAIACHLHDILEKWGLRPSPA